MFDLCSWLEANAEIQSRSGSEWVLRCHCDRLHHSKEWHLWVNVDKGAGICYRCRAKLPTVVSVVAFVGGVGTREAGSIVGEGSTRLSRLATVVRHLLPGAEDAGQKRVASRVELPAEFVPFRRGEPFPQYIRTRRLTAEQCRRLGIGWCKSGYYAHRLIVPVRSPEGELVSFVARWIGTPPPDLPKVLYPKGSKISQYLFDEAEASKSRVIVVTEGVFDALRVPMGGVALFGKIASDAQIDRLVRLGQDRRIVIMLDTDAQKEARALASRLAGVVDVRVASLALGRKDPGECPTLELGERIACARPFGRFGRLAAI